MFVCHTIAKNYKSNKNLTFIFINLVTVPQLGRKINKILISTQLLIAAEVSIQKDATASHYPRWKD